MQDVKDLTQRLIEAWAGVEENVIQNVIDHRRRPLHTCIQLQEDIVNIHCDKNKLKFIVEQDTSFRLSQVS